MSVTGVREGAYNDARPSLECDAGVQTSILRPCASLEFTGHLPGNRLYCRQKSESLCSLCLSWPVQLRYEEPKVKIQSNDVPDDLRASTPKPLQGWVSRWCPSSGRVGALALITSLGLGFGLTGCEGDETGAESDADILFEDANNYSSSAVLTLPTIQTASGVEMDLCWGGATNDIQCHDVDPLLGIDNIAILRFRNMTPEQVQLGMANGELPQSAVDGYLEYHTDKLDTCAKLSDLNFIGTEVNVFEEYVESPENVYVMLAAQGTTPGVGARVLSFLQPTSQSANTRVELGGGCGTLDFSANLSALTPLEIPSNGPWLLDWGSTSLDSLGNPILHQNIDRVLMGFYANTSVAQLQDQVMDMELIATELYDASLAGGTEFDLSLLTSVQGDQPFGGFTPGGTWVLALMCTTCQNPAPILMSVVSPVP